MEPQSKDFDTSHLYLNGLQWLRKIKRIYCLRNDKVYNSLFLSLIKKKKFFLIGRRSKILSICMIPYFLIYLFIFFYKKIFLSRRHINNIYNLASLLSSMIIFPLKFFYLNSFFFLKKKLSFIRSHIFIFIFFISFHFHFHFFTCTVQVW